MKTALLSFALLFALSGFSQSTVFAPKGAVWHYSKYQEWCEPAVGAFTWTADQDTVINGWNARAIHFNDLKAGVSLQVDSLTKYVAIQGDKVYWLVAGQFVTLFDFGAIPGDTIQSAVEEPTVYTGCSQGVGIFKYRIDSISTIMVDGASLRVQHVSHVHIPGFMDADWGMAFWSGATIVERLGATNAGNWFGQGLSCILLGCPPFIRCYSDNDLSYQSPKWESLNKPCDYTTKIEEAGCANCGISVSASPTSDEVTVETEEIMLGYRLVDMSGRVLQDVQHLRKEGVRAFSVSLAEEAAGVYLLAVHTERGWLVKKVVKT